MAAIVTGEAAHAKLLEALQHLNPLPVQYREAVQQFPENVLEREEGPVPENGHQPLSVLELLDEGVLVHDDEPLPMPQFTELEAGLRDLEWSLWPHGSHNLGTGAFGSVQLIFKNEDLNLPFPRRRMAALKIQRMTDANAPQLWTEINVLNCVRHRNIVDYYGAFAVTPKTGAVREWEARIGLRALSPRKRKESAKALGPRRAERHFYSEYYTRWAERAGSPRTPKANQSKEEKAAAELEEEERRKKQRQREKEKHEDEMYAERWAERAAGSPTPRVYESPEAAELEEQRREKQRERERKRLRVDQVNDTFCILMEYVNAGTLRAEILRHPNRHLSEPAARYYMREIIAGISYLHSKVIVHDDLHSNNVLMKYNQDGVTKRCVVCDLGNCKIPVWNNGMWQPSVPYSNDVAGLKRYMSRMVRGYVGYGIGIAPPIIVAITLNARDVLRNTTTWNCAQLLQFPWFNGEAVPPVLGLPRHATVPVLLNPHSPTRQDRAEPLSPDFTWLVDPRPHSETVKEYLPFKHLSGSLSDPPGEAGARRPPRRLPVKRQGFYHVGTAGQKRKEPEPDDPSPSAKPSRVQTRSVTRWTAANEAPARRQVLRFGAPAAAASGQPASMAEPIAGPSSQPDTLHAASETLAQTAPLDLSSAHAKQRFARRQAAARTASAVAAPSAAPASGGPPRVQTRSAKRQAAATASVQPEAPVRREGLRSGTRAAAAVASQPKGQAQEDSSSNSSDAPT